MSYLRLSRRGGVIGLLAALPLMLPAGPPAGAAQIDAPSAHSFEFVSIEGTPLPLAAFEGKAILLVNTASRCGFTPQYEGLQALWEAYQGRGLVVVGVPSNDFAGQEPGSNDEIKEFCEVTFGIDFPMTEKQKVRGADAHPLYLWIAQRLDRNPVPRWNFHKFLIDPDGAVVAGFPTRVEPDAPELRRAIEALLPR